MIWDFVIIGAVVIIFLVLARQIPLAKKMREEVEISPESMTNYGKIAQADDAFDKKDFEKAEELYVKAAAADPDNVKIYSRLGAIYLEQKNFYDAKEAFLQAVKLDSDTASRQVNLGLAYMGLKDYFKATEVFRVALKMDPKNKKYQDLLEKAEKLVAKEKK